MTVDRSLPAEPVDRADRLETSWLSVSSPVADTWFVPLSDLPLTIGRGRSCDLVLDDQRVSRVHARLERGAGGLVVIDLDSTNGIVCNDASVSGRCAVEFGDTIGIGDHRLELVESVADGAVAPGWTTD